MVQRGIAQGLGSADDVFRLFECHRVVSHTDGGFGVGVDDARVACGLVFQGVDIARRRISHSLLERLHLPSDGRDGEFGRGLRLRDWKASTTSGAARNFSTVQLLRYLSLIHI